MVKHFLLICLYGFVTLLSPAISQAAEWEQVQDTFILSDNTREVNCIISHPRQQLHLFRVQLVIFEDNIHQEYFALVMYRHEQYTLIEGTDSYSRFRENCGLPEKYQRWFP